MYISTMKSSYPKQDLRTFKTDFFWIDACHGLEKSCVSICVSLYVYCYTYNIQYVSKNGPVRCHWHCNIDFWIGA